MAKYASMKIRLIVQARYLFISTICTVNGNSHKLIKRLYKLDISYIIVCTRKFIKRKKNNGGIYINENVID